MLIFWVGIHVFIFHGGNFRSMHILRITVKRMSIQICVSFWPRENSANPLRPGDVHIYYQMDSQEKNSSEYWIRLYQSPFDWKQLNMLPAKMQLILSVPKFVETEFKAMLSNFIYFSLGWYLTTSTSFDTKSIYLTPNLSNLFLFQWSCELIARGEGQYLYNIRGNALWSITFVQ